MAAPNSLVIAETMFFGFQSSRRAASQQYSDLTPAQAGKHCIAEIFVKSRSFGDRVP
jgi:hypothetical protein